MADPAKNLNMLRKCGIQEWILGDDGAWKGFIDFFQNNITEANILSDAELLERSATQNGNESMTTEELIQKKDKISKTYKGFWSVKEKDVKRQQKQLDFAKQTEEQYNDLVLNAKKEDVNITEELALMAVKLDKMKAIEENASRLCLERMNELENAKSAMEHKIIELGQLYVKPSKNKLFMHQMSLNDYFTKLDTFNKAAEQYTQKNFDVQGDTAPENDQKITTDRKLYDELNKVADRLLNVYNGLCLERMKANGKSQLVERLKGQNWTPSTLTAIKNEIAKMESEEQNLALEKNELMIKLQEQSIEFARMDIETVIFDFNKKRMARAGQRKQHVGHFVNAVSDAMLIAEIIWILMQIDIERMKKRNDFDTKLDKYRIDSLICDRRLDIIKSMSNIEQKDEEFLRFYCSKILKILKPNQMVRELDINNDRVIEAIMDKHEFKTGIFDLLKSLGDKTQFLIEDSVFLGNAASIQNTLLKVLNDGPVEMHQYWTVDYLKLKANLEKSLKSHRTEISAMKEDSRYYIQKMKNDNLWMQKQMLWVWFLTEPKKVIKAIKLVKTIAQQKSKERTSRPLAGLLRKA